jgi:hypothetical protein
MAAEDQSALAPFFSSVNESTDTVPTCDVLLIYCDLNADGSVAGTAAKLREISRDAGAVIAIVASENPGARLRESARESAPIYGPLNLVLTYDRKGEFFTTFFGRLFEKMAKDGMSMPNAWLKLAPQVSGAVYSECAETLCQFARQVTFER